jgi:chromosome segregation ATPase
MSLEKMETLEVRVRGLVALVQELKQAHASLQEQLSLAQEELARQEDYGREWEEERENIRLRIEKVLEQLDNMDASEAGLQEAVHD